MKLRVFLADDDQVLADLLRAAITSKEAEIKSVDRGSMALMELKDFQPHLAFFNANLKGVSGYDLCEIVKQDPELNHTKVVLLDSDSEPLDAERAESVNFDASLRKPFSVDNIILLLESLDVEGFEQPVEETEDFFDINDPGEIELTDTSSVFETSPDETSDDRSELLGGDAEDFTVMLDNGDEQPDSDFSTSTTVTTKKVSLEQILNMEAGQKIVSEIVRQLSDSVVREVAWQVVPELAEEIIKETIDKLQKKKNK